jgi:hypothetical protein
VSCLDLEILTMRLRSDKAEQRDCDCSEDEILHIARKEGILELELSKCLGSAGQ